jgi:hypothetical protein
MKLSKSSVHTYIRRVPSTTVWTFGVMLDNPSIKNPIQVHGFNQDQELNLGVINLGASKGLSIKSI